jgi:hypothetical protein
LGSDAVAELSAELLMMRVEAPVRHLCQTVFADRSATPLYVAQVLRLLLARGHLTAAGQRWGGRWDFSKLGDQAHLLVPATVEEVAGERAARLSVETKSLLSLAAVIGRRVALPTLVRASGLDENLVRDCVDEAQRAGFLADDVASHDDERLIFTHDRLREAMYQGLPEAQRTHYHRIVADALLARSRRGGREVAADVAFHTYEAGDHARAYRYGIIAGERAARHGQFARASELFSQAVQSAQAQDRPVPRRIWERLGDTASLAVLVDRAHSAYRRVLDQTTTVAGQVRVTAKLGDLYLRAHDPARALRYYRRATRHGLPWLLRAAPIWWPRLVLFLLAINLLPPRWAWATARALWLGAGATRLEAVQQAALPAAIWSGTNSRFFGMIHFGVMVLTAGLALRGRSRLGGPEVACATARFGNALFSRDRAARAWAQFAGAAAVERMSPRNRLVYLTIDGCADLFFANDPSVWAAKLRGGMDLSLAQKDPLFVRVSGRCLTIGEMLLSRNAEAKAAARQVTRFGEAEHLEQVTREARDMEIAVDYLFLAPVTLDQVLDRIGTGLREVNIDDKFLRELLVGIAPHVALAGGRAPDRVVDDACVHLAKRWHGGMDLPILAVNSLVYIAAMMAWGRLPTMPAEQIQVLARCRRRFRPVDGRGRWRRPLWLFGHALYDDRTGRPDRALRHLDRAFALFSPYPRMIWRISCCRWGLTAFVPGSALHDRCRAELDSIERELPDLGELVARIRDVTRSEPA